MAGEVLTLIGVGPEDLSMASAIGSKWEMWHSQMAPYLTISQEVQEFIQASDISNTSNEETSTWNNTTHIPKLCQIRDNLYANYQTGLFPNDQWLRWDQDGKDKVKKEKRQAIEGYMRNKVRYEEFRRTINELILDYIDYGNCYAYAEYIKIVRGEEEQVVYEGPVPRRIDPNDIVYNPAAKSWNETPIITRALMTMGDFVRWAADLPSGPKEKADEIIKMRVKFAAGGFGKELYEKAEKLSIAGLGDINEYLSSDQLETLTFYGDWYNPDTGELLTNRKIVVVDRMFVLIDEANDSWVGKPITHAVWRRRSNSLVGMSVLENLVGMQYRINHLENMKADAIDLNVYPPFKTRGRVEIQQWGPGAELHIPDTTDGSDIELLSPNLAALQIDLEIQNIMDWMEEFAGAPKQTMGFRTPGEKTAFEVEQLMTSAGRVFQEKITNFEVMCLEPLLNLMLSEARNNLTGADLALVFDDKANMAQFVDVSASDIKTSGRIRPVGARHYSEQRQMIQNLVGIFNTPLGQKMLPHVAGTDLYPVVENLFGIEKWQLFRTNAALEEAMEQQRLATEIQARNNEVATTEIPK